MTDSLVSWKLAAEAEEHLARGDIPRAILDLGIALDLHVTLRADQYRPQVPGLKETSWKFYSRYENDLPRATGRSLHDAPALARALEYIHELRNNIAHNWLPRFEARNLNGRRKSRYLAEHERRDGHVIVDPAEVEELIGLTRQILEFVDEAFRSKYGPIEAAEGQYTDLTNENGARGLRQ
jgi:hypothetical protein